MGSSRRRAFILKRDSIGSVRHSGTASEGLELARWSRIPPPAIDSTSQQISEGHSLILAAPLAPDTMRTCDRARAPATLEFVLRTDNAAAVRAIEIGSFCLWLRGVFASRSINLFAGFPRVRPALRYRAARQCHKSRVFWQAPPTAGAHSRRRADYHRIPLGPPYSPNQLRLAV